MELIPWERWLLVHSLELLPDGRPRFRTVLLLVARQNGKSTVLQILSLWVMYVLGRKLVIGTAQNLDVAEEVWQGAVEIAEEIDELADEIAQVSKVNGKKFLRLETGERYKVAAASRRGGRGLSGDLVMLDELREHQSWDAWGAVTKTTMARANAQVWGASNAGDAASVVLRYLRKMAHLLIGDPDGLGSQDAIVWDDEDEDTDDSLGIFEWSAPPGCSVMDRDGWVQANPSLGYTITERAIRSAANTDPEWVFRTEVLCQWMEGTTEGPFPTGSWEACQDDDSTVPADELVTFCVTVSADRSTSWIAAAGKRSDGVPHVEVVEASSGTEWVAGWLTETDTRKATPVAVMHKGAPESSLVLELEEAGVTLVDWKTADTGPATGDFYDRVARTAREEDPQPPGLYHRGQPALTIAASNAVTKPSSDGFVWDLRHSPVDVAPLKAVTGALWLLGTYEPDTEASGDFIVI